MWEARALMTERFSGATRDEAFRRAAAFVRAVLADDPDVTPDDIASEIDDISVHPRRI